MPREIILPGISTPPPNAYGPSQVFRLARTTDAVSYTRLRSGADVLWVTHVIITLYSGGRMRFAMGGSNHFPADDFTQGRWLDVRRSGLAASTVRWGQQKSHPFSKASFISHVTVEDTVIVEPRIFIPSANSYWVYPLGPAEWTATFYWFEG